MTKNLFEQAGNFTSEDTLRMANLNRVTDAISMSYIERNGGCDWTPRPYNKIDPTTVTWGIFDMPTTKLVREDQNLHNPRNLVPAINPVVYPDLYNCRYYDYTNSYAGWSGATTTSSNISALIGWPEAKLPKLPTGPNGNFYVGGSPSSFWYNPNRWSAFVSAMNINSSVSQTKLPLIAPVWYLEDILAELGVDELERCYRFHQPSRKWFKQMHDIHQILGTKQFLVNTLKLIQRDSGYSYYKWTDAIQISKLPEVYYTVWDASGMNTNCDYPVTADRWMFYGADYADIPAINGISQGFNYLDTVSYDSMPEVSTQIDTFNLATPFGGSWHYSWLHCYSIVDYKSRWKYYPW